MASHDQIENIRLYREWLEENWEPCDESSPPDAPPEDGFHLFSQEVDALVRCIQGDLNEEAAAKQLLVETEVQKRLTPAPRQGQSIWSKESRLKDVFYQSVLNWEDLHEPLYSLYSAVRKLESEDAAFDKSNLHGEVEEEIAEGYGIGERMSQEESLTTHHEEYIAFSGWYAIQTARERDSERLHDAFWTIIYGLEQDLEYADDEETNAWTGPNRAVPIASRWLIFCSDMILAMIVEGTNPSLDPPWPATARWPEVKGSKVTLERWGLWRQRVGDFAMSSEPQLSHEARKLADKASQAMDKAGS